MADVNCEWSEGEEEGEYDTSCGHSYSFSADGPDENEFKFCPFCSKKLVVAEESGD